MCLAGMCQVVVFSLVKVHSLFIKFYFNNIFFIYLPLCFPHTPALKCCVQLEIWFLWFQSFFFPLSFSLLVFFLFTNILRRWPFYKFKSTKCKSMWKFVSLGPFDNKRALSKRFLKQYVWVIFFDSNIMHNDIIISIIQY